MTIDDRLLSFQIKETVFLSKDKAGIGELKELELLPDVEIIENSQEISITGCLQLHGRYEPAREALEGEAGGSETLLSAMQFTPFQLEDEHESSYLTGREEGLTHRIPLNVTIPLTRVKEIGEIYAIVDGLDYEVKTPHHLTIQADLKISGIELEHTADSKAKEKWEFAHVAGQDGQEAEPVSIDEIERKLAQLEQEVEQQRLRERIIPPAPYLATDSLQDDEDQRSYTQNEAEGQAASAKPARQMAKQEPPVTYNQLADEEPGLFGDVPEMRTAGGESRPSADRMEAKLAVGGGREADSAPESAARQKPIDKKAFTDGDPPIEQQEEKLPQNSKPTADMTGDKESVQKNASEAAGTGEAAAAIPAPAGSKAEEEPQETPEQTLVQAEPSEHTEQTATEENDAGKTESLAAQREFKVAISGKSSKEKEESLNLTSIFTHAGRAEAKQPTEEKEKPEQELTAEQSEQDDEETRTSLDTLSNLSSFVRGGEETFSKVKMCIIQRDETIEEIAQRYAVSVSSILEANNLSSENLVEGQVLYIPR
ncbi:MAG: LysM peptidoglycan-binding domain-containing protein [Brevibacillus sp.]|nr:LysM peptidoglycan-binding domain-containing protein [Brevibacillus sp.]